MDARKKFNDYAREFGNKVYFGFGDLLVTHLDKDALMRGGLATAIAVSSVGCATTRAVAAPVNPLRGQLEDVKDFAFSEEAPGSRYSSANPADTLQGLSDSESTRAKQILRQYPGLDANKAYLLARDAHLIIESGNSSNLGEAVKRWVASDFSNYDSAGQVKIYDAISGRLRDHRYNLVHPPLRGSSVYILPKDALEAGVKVAMLLDNIAQAESEPRPLALTSPDDLIAQSSQPVDPCSGSEVDRNLAAVRAEAWDQVQDASLDSETTIDDYTSISSDAGKALDSAIGSCPRNRVEIKKTKRDLRTEIADFVCSTDDDVLSNMAQDIKEDIEERMAGGVSLRTLRGYSSNPNEGFAKLKGFCGDYAGAIAALGTIGQQIDAALDKAHEENIEALERTVYDMMQNKTPPGKIVKLINSRTRELSYEANGSDAAVQAVLSKGDNLTVLVNNGYACGDDVEAFFESNLDKIMTIARDMMTANMSSSDIRSYLKVAAGKLSKNCAPVHPEAVVKIDEKVRKLEPELKEYECGRSLSSIDLKVKAAIAANTSVKDVKKMRRSALDAYDQLLVRCAGTSDILHAVDKKRQEINAVFAQYVKANKTCIPRNCD